MDWKYYTNTVSPHHTTQSIMKTHVTPPRARSPPEHADPRAFSLLHRAERAEYGLDAVRVRTRTHLAEEALQAVSLEPRSRVGETLCADCA